MHCSGTRASFFCAYLRYLGTYFQLGLESFDESTGPRPEKTFTLVWIMPSMYAPSLLAMVIRGPRRCARVLEPGGVLGSP